MLEQGRLVVGDAVWQKVAPLLPGKASDPDATARDNRLFLEAVLWGGGGGGPPRGPPRRVWVVGKGVSRGVVVGVGAGRPWGGLAGGFGWWKCVFPGFRRWVKGGVFERVFACLFGQPGFEFGLIEGHFVPGPRKGGGGRGGTQNQAI